MTVDPAIARLCAILDELVAVLAEHGEARWAAWLTRDTARIRGGDGYGVTHLLSAFGGMGSLSDVTLGNGSDADRLDSLRREAYRLASGLARQSRPGPRPDPADDGAGKPRA